MRKLYFSLVAILFSSSAFFIGKSTIAQGIWSQRANFGGVSRMESVGFSILEKGYFGLGEDNFYNKKNDFWEYDPTNNVWTQKADFVGTERKLAVGFSIGSKGYIGTGIQNNSPFQKNDFWEYNPVTNTWVQKADFGGIARNSAVGFSIGTKGYIGTGSGQKDFWEYDQSSNAWTQKADFGGVGRNEAVGFSIGTKGYIGTGDNGSNSILDFWEWDQTTNIWMQKADFGGTARRGAVGFVIGTKGYIGSGYDGAPKQDFWEYNPSSNSWLPIPSFIGTPRFSAVGFSINGKGYIGTGRDADSARTDFFEFDPCSGLTTSLNSTNVTCNGSNNGTATAIPIGGTTPYTYLWSNSQTTSTITGLAAGIYSVTVADSTGCTAIATDTITEPPFVATYTDTVNLILHDGINCIDYPIVKIGNQWWMKENVNASKYSDGSPLIDGTGSGIISGDYTTKYYFNYNDTAAYSGTYGKLYTWAAATNGAGGSDSIPSGVQGVCPTGWYLPGDGEWKQLETGLGMSQAAADATSWRGTDEGLKLKDNIAWNGTNTSGFSALPAGYRHFSDSTFWYMGSYGIYWTSADNGNDAWSRSFDSGSNQISRNLYGKTYGFSVRCLKSTCSDILVSIDTTVCPGGSVTVGSNTYTVSGTYYDTIPMVGGCDSIITTNLTVPQIANVGENSNGLPSSLQNGLVAYYPFYGNANDESGNGNNGTVNGATLTADRFGNASNAYYFANSDTINAGNIPVFQTSTFSVSVWVLEQDTSGGDAILGTSKHISGSDGFTLTYFPSTQYLQFIGQTWPPGGVDNLILNNGNWFNIVLTTDEFTSEIFINGVLQNSASSNYISNNMNFLIGNAESQADVSFLGKIDDIGIWNRVLSLTEIQALYNEGSALSVSLSNDTICSGNSTQVQINNSQPGVSYQLSLNGSQYGSAQVGNGDTLVFNTTLLTATATATISATDTATSCSIQLDTTLTVFVSSLSLTTSQTNVTCYTGTNGTINVTPSGGISPYTYLWSNSQTTSTITGLSAGNFSLTVTDTVGCTATSSASIAVNTPGSWTQKANFGGSERNGAVGFSIGTKGYIGTGYNGSCKKDFWEYDQSSNTWTQKADFGGVARQCAVGFAIGSKGYLGTGKDSSGVKKNDFWEYDPNTNSWTQKNNFGGVARYGATGFSIGTKGYIGTGYDDGGTYFKDFWEWDQTSNTWIQKADFGGTVRHYSTGFSIGLKGYIGLGWGSGGYVEDFWEWNQNTNTWTQKANFGGGIRDVAVGFSIGNKGYIGTGNDNVGHNDFWEWNQSTNTWIQKATFIGTPRQWAVGFSIGTKGYLGTGYDTLSTYKNDFYEFDPFGGLLATNISTTAVSCNGGINGTATAIPTGGFSPYTYLWSNSQSTATITGLTVGNYSVSVSDSASCVANASYAVEVFKPGAWLQKASLGTVGRLGAVSFSIGAKGYIGTGMDSANTKYKDFWEYDPSNNTWTQKADFGGTARYYAVGFSIGTKGYIGTGMDSASTKYKDFWEYDPSNNIWVQKADFGGTPRYVAVGFSIGDKGYIGTGNDGAKRKDFWEYDPLNDTWFQKTDFGGTVRTNAVGFSIGAKGYVGTGSDGVYKNDFWEYDPSGNYWSQKADFGGAIRINAIGFSIGTKGFIGTGNSGNTFYKDLWEFNPNSNIWIQKISFIGISRRNAVGFSIGTKGYIGTGYDNAGIFNNDLYEFDPTSGLLATNASTTAVSCNGGNNGTATATPTGGFSPYTYLWSNSQTTATATGLIAGSYSVTVTDSSGCTDIATATISQPSAVEITIDSVLSVSCNGGSNGAIYTTTTGGTGSYTYLWSCGCTPEDLLNRAAGAYTVTVTDANGCTDTSSANITQPTALSISTFNPSFITCYGYSDGALNPDYTGGTTPYSFLWSNGNTTGGISNLAAGTYSFTVTDANGCTFSDYMYLTEPPLITSTANASICNGDSIFLQGNYQTSSGTYYDTISAVNGCDSIVTTTLTLIPGPGITVSSTDATCNGCSDGTATATPSGGSTPFYYLWSNSQTTQTATGLTAGIYTVTVSDANGCTTSGTATITQPTCNLTASVSSVNVACNGAVTGSATVTPTGGTSPFSYLWSNGKITAQITNLTANFYSVTVTDANGCSATANVTITQPSALSVSATTSPATCGVSNGSALVSANGGNSPYSYQWSSGDTSAFVDSLASGVYMVTATDANGCSNFSPAIINNTGAPVISVSSITSVSCNGGNNGAIDISVNGGSTPYTYTWSNGATTQDLSNLSMSPYEIIVAGANGCTAAQSIFVAQPNALTVTTSFTSASCGNADGSATATASGGTSPYSYLWSNGANVPQIINVPAQTYTITITDAQNCSATALAAIGETGGAAVLVDSITPAGCNGGGSVYVSVSGGTSPYTYSWTNSAATQNLINATAGNYGLIVTDSNGCSGAVSASIPFRQIMFDPICLITVDTVTETNKLVWEKTFGMGISYYRIYKEQTIAGVYQLVGTVPFANLSVFTDSVANPLIRSWRYKISAVDSCGNESPLSPEHKTMHVTVSQGLNNTVNLIWDYYQGFYYPTYYIWRFKPQTGWLLRDSLPGNLTSWTDFTPPTPFALRYLIEIIHPDGCAATKSVENHNSSRSNKTFMMGPAPPEIVPSATVTDATQGNCDGEVVLAVTGGISPYTYLWSTTPQQTTETATGLCAGDYTVTITDTEGDTAIVNVTVGVQIGIAEESGIAIYRVYPNPSKGIFTLENTGVQVEKAQIVIVNLVGETVYQSQLSGQPGVKPQMEIDISNHGKGIYFLQVITEKGASVPLKITLQ